MTPPDAPRPTTSRLAVFGREDVLTRLHEVFARSLAGTRQVVFITGEPGIGKTTVVDALLEQIGERHSVRIGRGQCLEHFGAAEAYLPILDALGRLCRRPGGEQVVALLQQHGPTWLAQMPALLAAADRERLARQLLGSTPQRMLREMAEAIEAISGNTPLVLVLEDLHWSDHSTLDLLASLARRGRRGAPSD